MAWWTDKPCSAAKVTENSKRAQANPILFFSVLVGHADWTVGQGGSNEQASVDHSVLSCAGMV